MVDTPVLTVGGWLLHGWRVFKQRRKPLIGASVVVGLISLAATSWIALGFKQWGGPWWFSIYAYTIAPILTAGYWSLCRKAVRGEGVRAIDVFAGLRRFVRVCVAGMLSHLIMMGGLALLVIPGVIWGLKYSLTLFAVMDRPMSAREAVRFSGKITEGYKGKLFLLCLITLLASAPAWPLSMGMMHFLLGDVTASKLIAIGVIPFLLWMLIICPWTTVAFASAYDNLARQPQLAEVEEPGVQMWIPAYLGAIAIVGGTALSIHGQGRMEKFQEEQLRGSAEYQSRLTKKEPVLYLPFDGTASDEGPYHFPMELTGDGIRYETGIQKESLFLGGENAVESHIYRNGRERVDFARGATLELWFNRSDWENPHRVGSTRQVLAVASGGGGNISLGILTEGKWQLYGAVLDRDQKSKEVVSLGRQVQPNTWVHAALVYDADAATLKLFMDGEVVDALQGVQTGKTWFPISLELGAWAKPPNEAFKGYLDEVKVYEFPRTVEEIAQASPTSKSHHELPGS